MNYVESFNLFGVNVKQIPCITGSGAPTTATEGAIGCFYMDTNTGMVYKCTAEASGAYTWEEFESGGGSVELDTTLTQEGMAADSKAVGDRLGDVDDAFDELHNYAQQLESEGGEPGGGMTEERVAILEALDSTVFETVLVPSLNLFNPSTAEVAPVFSGAYWWSGIIPCSVGDVIYVKKLYDSAFDGMNFGVCLVGESGGAAYPTLSAYKTYTVEDHPSTPDLIGLRILVKLSAVPIEQCADVMVTINTEPTEYQAWTPGEETKESRVQKNADQIAILNTRTASRWSGKNVLVFGDSISTDEYASYTKWATVLKESAGFELFNYSVHGYGFVCGQGSAAQGEYNMINQIENAHNDGVNPDLVILFMGTNDFGNAVPIGKAGDGTNLEMYSKNAYLTPTATASSITTFYGGVEHCMARIKQLWPAALVCVLSPLQRINQTSATAGMALVDYRDIIVETAKRFTFPVKDLYNESNFCPCNLYDRETKTYQFPADSPYAGGYDGLHPNEAYCRDVLAPMIGRFIENI